MSRLMQPGDFVFGDFDGVVIVPKELIVEVLLEAEKIVQVENKIRKGIHRGGSLAELYQKYGRL